MENGFASRYPGVRDAHCAGGFVPSVPTAPRRPGGGDLSYERSLLARDLRAAAIDIDRLERATLVEVAVLAAVDDGLQRERAVAAAGELERELARLARGELDRLLVLGDRDRVALTTFGPAIVDRRRAQADRPPRFAVARAVADGTADLGIIIDGAGIGSAMTANKVPGVRAAACYSLDVASNSREHNDANVLTLGSKTITGSQMREIVGVWLATEIKEDRHRKRVAKITAVERQYSA